MLKIQNNLYNKILIIVDLGCVNFQINMVCNSNYILVIGITCSIDAENC